jgi:uncharacterized protein (DUF1800 family)
MSKKMKTLIAPFTVFSLLAATSSILAAPPEITLHEDAVDLSLPGPAVAGEFRILESSTDLENWFPVARDYGFFWENVFPKALPITPGAFGQILTDDMDAPQRFYRVAESVADNLSNRHAASRFLQQATFGPTRAMIDNFPGIDDAGGFNDFPYTRYEEWIDAEMSKPHTSFRAHWRERANPAYEQGSDAYEVAFNPSFGQDYIYWDGSGIHNPSNNLIYRNRTREAAWYHVAITADDVLRQRAAWALSQTFVLSTSGMGQLDTCEQWLNYYDIFVRNAFGNFRDILETVTYSPMMGLYLTYQGNRKANADQGTFPDENFAREIMQLFTIGLWLLNQDGTLVLDSNGDPVPTYDNDDIFEFAKIFTGFRFEETRTNIEIRGGGNRIDPMRVNTNWHDYTEKTLLDYDGPEGPLTAPTLVAATQIEAGMRQEISDFLDHLHNHPNVPPFIARNLIQRMTVSNPSPNYINAVAGAFISGNYNGVGSGIRGDLSALFRAILLHPEAREPGLTVDTAHGRLREPLIRLLSYARAFEIAPVTSSNPHGLIAFETIDELIAQAPFASPSVFNFYLPEFQPAGAVQEQGLNAPEFQIHNDFTAVSLPNALRNLVRNGTRSGLGINNLESELDLSYEIGLAGNSSTGRKQLIDHLELMLAPGRLSPSNRSTLITAIKTIDGNSDTDRRARVEMALSLFPFLPEFNILY